MTRMYPGSLGHEEQGVVALVTELGVLELRVLLVPVEVLLY